MLGMLLALHSNYCTQFIPFNEKCQGDNHITRRCNSSGYLLKPQLSNYFLKRKMFNANLKFCHLSCEIFKLKCDLLRNAVEIITVMIGPYIVLINSNEGS